MSAMTRPSTGSRSAKRSNGRPRTWVANAGLVDPALATHVRGLPFDRFADRLPVLGRVIADIVARVDDEADGGDRSGGVGAQLRGLLLPPGLHGSDPGRPGRYAAAIGFHHIAVPHGFDPVLHPGDELIVADGGRLVGEAPVGLLLGDVLGHVIERPVPLEGRQSERRAPAVVVVHVTDEEFRVRIEFLELHTQLSRVLPDEEEVLRRELPAGETAVALLAGLLLLDKPVRLIDGAAQVPALLLVNEGIHAAVAVETAGMLHHRKQLLELFDRLLLLPPGEGTGGGTPEGWPVRRREGRRRAGIDSGALEDCCAGLTQCQRTGKRKGDREPSGTDHGLPGEGEVPFR